MKLLPKGYDESNPVLVLFGTFFIIAGGYGLAIMGISGPPILWLLRGIPATFVAMGALIVIRQFQRRRRGTAIVSLVGVLLVGSILTRNSVLISLAGIATFGFLLWHWIRDRKVN